MALNLDSVGKSSDARTFVYRWQDAVLYALGIGAKVEELEFLYEGLGPRVFPTFAVVPALQVVADLLPVIGGNPMGIVHGGQTIRLHRPFAPHDKLVTVGKVQGLWDLKRMAAADISTQTHNAIGDLICETEWSIIYRFDGGTGGPTPPPSPKYNAPDRAPDFRVEEASVAEQAALYRLNGDLNPLHIDPKIGQAAGFGRPILHGLCTYGYAGRAVLHHVCGGDPAKLASLTGQFRKPVLPGDTIITEGWREGSRVILRCSTKERPDDHVFTNACAEIA